VVLGGPVAPVVKEPELAKVVSEAKAGQVVTEAQVVLEVLVRAQEAHLRNRHSHCTSS
jgi:hypothetical protein